MRTPRSVAAGLSVLLLLATSCGSPVGREYPDERALIRALGDLHVVGRFELRFPATVREIVRGQGGVRFQRGDTPQEYSGFDGYELYAVRTACQGREGWLVLRSTGQP